MLWLLLLACVVRLPEPTEAMVTQAQTQSPAASLDSLTTGRKLALRRCGSCHAPPKPGAVLDDEWPELWDDMVGEAKLTPEQAELIATYLHAAATTPEPVEPTH